MLDVLTWYLGNPPAGRTSGRSQSLAVPDSALAQAAGGDTCSCDIPGRCHRLVGRRVPFVSGALAAAVVAAVEIENAHW